jgi:hypothetical protein
MNIDIFGIVITIKIKKNYQNQRSGVFKLVVNKVWRVKNLIENLSTLSPLLIKNNKIQNQILIETKKKSVFETLERYINYSDNRNINNLIDECSKKLIIKNIHRSSKICVCTLGIGSEYRKKYIKCLQSISEYSNSKNYSFADLEIIPTRADRPIPWYKIPLIYNLLERGYEYVFFIDADCMITNSKIDLNYYIDNFEENKSFLLCKDEGGINTGVMLIRNTTRAKDILGFTWMSDYDVAHPNWEQEAFKNLIKEFDSIYKSIQVHDKRNSFNKFPCERVQLYPEIVIQPNTWTPGDFIVHFSGIKSPHAEHLINQYNQNI